MARRRRARCGCMRPPCLKELKYYQDAVLLLCCLDLGPAKPILERCYSESPRGSTRYDPLAMFRLILLGAAIGVMGINALVRRVRHSRVLAVLAGFPMDVNGEVRTPAVATVYDLLHRLHDGPIRRVRGVARPSVTEYERTQTPLRPEVRHGKESADSTDSPDGEANGPGTGSNKKKTSKSKGKASSRKSYRNRARGAGQVTEALRLALVKQDRNELPDNLCTRLMEILDAVAIRPSAEAGLLGDVHALLLAGDGSPLPTNADGHGKKVESCPHSRWERCDCPRTWADPDAARGWDHYRETYYFGYNFYECCSVGGPKELPVFIGLDPANTNDQLASMKGLSMLTRYFRRAPGGFEIGTFIGDCGHDGEPLHRYVYHDLDIKPVIPISGEVPAVHPIRKDVHLDRATAVPLCEAGCTMAAWGTAGEGRTSFICPVKAGKIKSCPLARPEQPDWVCRPEQKYGPTVVMNVDDNPRLFPVIARNSKKFEDLYKKRPACERSNAFKKETGHIEDCGHRRWSFWLFRLYNLAIIQHAQAWVARMNAEQNLLKLLELDEVVAKA